MKLPEIKFFQTKLHNIAAIAGALVLAVLILLGVNSLANAQKNDISDVSSDISDSAIADEMDKVSSEAEESGVAQ